jgi:hypothetical protein
MNNAQRRLLEEAAKFGGANVSKVEKMAEAITPERTEAYAPASFPLKDIIGGFIEKSKKKRFEYRKSTNEWGKKNGYPHEVFVGPDESKGQTRPALVKGTVCYIVVDEGADGKPVVEKWAITKHWTRAAEGVEETGEDIVEGVKSLPGAEKVMEKEGIGRDLHKSYRKIKKNLESMPVGSVVIFTKEKGTGGDQYEIQTLSSSEFDRWNGSFTKKMERKPGSKGITNWGEVTVFAVKESVEEAFKGNPEQTAGIPRLVVDGKVVAMGSKQSLVKLAKEKYGGLKLGKVFVAHTNKTVGQSWNESVDEAKTGDIGLRTDLHHPKGKAVLDKSGKVVAIYKSEKAARTHAMTGKPVKEDVEETGETLNELHYRKAIDKPLIVPPKWAYDSFFKVLKKTPESLFNQLKAEEALESVYSKALLGGKNDLGGRISGDWGKIYANAEVKYKTLMGMKEEAEETDETLEEFFRVNDPRFYAAAEKALPQKHRNQHNIMRMAAIMWKIYSDSNGSVKMSELVRLARVSLGLNEEAEEDTQSVSEAITPDDALRKAKEIMAKAKELGVTVSANKTVITCVKEFPKGDADAFFKAYSDCDKIRKMVPFKSRTNEWGCSTAGVGIGGQECIKAGRAVLNKSGDGAFAVLRMLGKAR